MDFVKTFNNYCDTVIGSKKIAIPDKNLAQAVRRQEFIVNYKTMKMYLADIFSKELENIEGQAHRENNPLTLEQRKEMRQTGENKIKDFVETAENEFQSN